jgi:hypothetical protein
MADTFTEVTSQGWLSRLMGSIKSVLVGLVMFLASFLVLFFNEGHSVKVARSLEEGAGVVVSVNALEVQPANDGKLVHMSGEATTQETLTDPVFGVRIAAIKLVRDVEMYQWEEDKKTEKRKKLGGGEETVTTYSYHKGWHERTIDSSRFKEPTGHGNPGSFPFPASHWTASKVTLGAFTLSEDLVDKIDDRVDVPIDAATLPEGLRASVRASGNGYYKGSDPASPQVGDLRVTFKAVKPATVSLLARQMKDTFEAYHTHAGADILRLSYGTLSAEVMFQQAQRENTIFTWVLRFVGFFLMFLGLTMIFRPIAVFADVVPLFGTLLGAGIGIFAGLTAAVLSLVTIAVAWIFFRPLLGISLLVLAAGALAALIALGVKRRAARAGTAARNVA